MAGRTIEAIAAEWANKILISREALPYDVDYLPDEMARLAAKQTGRFLQEFFPSAVATFARRNGMPPDEVTPAMRIALAEEILTAICLAAEAQVRLDGQTAQQVREQLTTDH